jgi:adenylate cyclase, class 2
MADKPSKPAKEIEVKLRIGNPVAIGKRLLALGYTKNVPRSLEENWTWDFPNQQLRKRGQLLRIRRFAGECLLTFKGGPIESRHFKVREELETEVGHLPVIARIFELIGLKVVFRYEKFRTSYLQTLPGKGGHINVTLDETPIGNFLEIEASGQNISKVAKDLGYRRQDFIKESYGVLFERSELRKRQRNMVFPRKRNGRIGRR